MPRNRRWRSGRAYPFAFLAGRLDKRGGANARRGVGDASDRLRRLERGGQDDGADAEFRGAPEPSLADLLRLVAPVDLGLFEGFKLDPLPKIEVYRAASGKLPIHPEDDRIVALISEGADPPTRLPHASIDDIAAVTDLVLPHAAPGRDHSRPVRAFVDGRVRPSKLRTSLCAPHSTMQQCRC
jgi:Molybdopterin guanine dinucleotide synthesis protein B